MGYKQFWMRLLFFLNETLKKNCTNYNIQYIVPVFDV